MNTPEEPALRATDPARSASKIRRAIRPPGVRPRSPRRAVRRHRAAPEPPARNAPLTGRAARRPGDTVPRVPGPRPDERVLVELAVQGGGPDVDVGVRLVD